MSEPSKWSTALVAASIGAAAAITSTVLAQRTAQRTSDERLAHDRQKALVDERSMNFEQTAKFAALLSDDKTAEMTLRLLVSREDLTGPLKDFAADELESVLARKPAASPPSAEQQMTGSDAQDPTQKTSSSSQSARTRVICKAIIQDLTTEATYTGTSGKAIGLPLDCSRRIKKGDRIRAVFSGDLTPLSSDQRSGLAVCVGPANANGAFLDACVISSVNSAGRQVVASNLYEVGEDGVSAYLLNWFNKLRVQGSVSIYKY